MFVSYLTKNTPGFNLYISKALNHRCNSLIKPCIPATADGKLAVHNRTLVTKPIKESMKAWQIQEFNGIQGMQWTSTKVPVILKPTEVLIKVSAASVNPIDLALLDGYGHNVLNALRNVDQMSMGKCDEQPEFPLTVGRDFAGKVMRVGQSVSNVKVHDKVLGVVSPQRQGSHAEYVVAESSNVCLKPESVTDIEAASVPYVGLTSWSAAVTTGELVPNECFGKSVLVIGASGGVGTFLSQLLSSWGAEVVGICSESSFELAQSCGVTEVYDYNHPDIFSILASTPRFDVIIDAGGFNDSRWAEGLREWNNASYVTLFSPLLRNTDEKGLLKGIFMSLLKLVHQNKTSLSYGRFCKWAYFMPNKTALQEITKLVAVGKIRPVIDKVFRAEDARDAFEHVNHGRKKGKTVLDFTS